MALDPTTAQAIADTFSIGQLKALRTTATEVFLNSAHVQRSFEGSNLTISKENAQDIIAAVQAAITLKTSGDPELNPPGAAGRNLIADFRTFQIF